MKTYSQLKEQLAEKDKEPPGPYVVIMNYGRGRQVIYPSNDDPQLFPKKEAERIAKEKNDDVKTKNTSEPYAHAQLIGDAMDPDNRYVTKRSEAMRALEKLDKIYFDESADIQEKAPITSDEDDSRRFVFKMPSAGESFTANFEDGSAPTVEASEESANKFCLIGKSNGKVLECWDDKPSESAVAKRVKEIKTFD